MQPQPELIVMLTLEDKTVSDAAARFEALSDLPVRSWGFKDVGLPSGQLVDLAHRMRDAGKRTYLEVVSLTEDEGLRGAELARDAGVDVLMGTTYSPRIQDAVRDTSTAYFPFAGRVSGHPSVLEGDAGSIAGHVRELAASGVDGVDLLAYRHPTAGDGVLAAAIQATSLPVVCAGSIASWDRLHTVLASGARGFTIGSALFESRFAPEKSLRDNLDAVVQFMAAQEPTGP